MRFQTVLAGVFGLAVLEAALSSDKAAGRVGQLLDAVATVISHVLSPTVPAIPDLRHKDASKSSPASADSNGSTVVQASSPTMPLDWSTSAKSLFV